jgi:hypothetical protein
MSQPWELSDSKLRDSAEFHMYNEFVAARRNYINEHGPDWAGDKER